MKTIMAEMAVLKRLGDRAEYLNGSVVQQDESPVKLQKCGCPPPTEKNLLGPGLGLKRSWRHCRRLDDPCPCWFTS